MPMEMVLNELSFRPAPSIIEARARMNDLLETVRHATARRVAKALRSDRDLNDIELAPGYLVRRWRNDNEIDRELKRYFLTLATKAPFLIDAPLAIARASGIDCFYNGERANGLLAAYLLDTLALSLRSAEAWEAPLVTISIEELSDTEPELIQADEQVHNASQHQHVSEVHRDWIDERTKMPEPRDGAELWAQCAERYAHLQFCEVVEDHLKQYRTGAEEITQIIKRLSDLNQYARSWTSGAFDSALLASKVTPESPETLRRYSQERTFHCPDGVDRIFSWHMRFTPGMGRLHLYPDNETHTITVGYIGPHLPTVLYH